MNKINIASVGDDKKVAMPFAFRFAERTGKLFMPGESEGEMFCDPTTVDNTGLYEDPHTDESSD